MLGMIIGVASVIAMVAVGNGASQQRAEHDPLAGLEPPHRLAREPRAIRRLLGAGAQAQTLTTEDMRAIQTQLGSTIAAIEAEQGAGAADDRRGDNWNTRERRDAGLL